jgi:hypothetical protein
MKPNKIIPINSFWNEANSPETIGRKIIDDEIVNTANHVDANVYGILPLELYRQTQNQIFFKQGIELADLQWAQPLPNGLTDQARFWVEFYLNRPRITGDFHGQAPILWFAYCLLLMHEQRNKRWQQFTIQS